MNFLANIFSNWCGGMNMGYMGGYGWFNILIIIAIVILIYVLIRNNRGSKKTDKTQSNNAVQILKKRLARGEIDKEEYRKLKDELEND